jgi:hypothetical protein
VITSNLGMMKLERWIEERVVSHRTGFVKKSGCWKIQRARKCGGFSPFLSAGAIGLRHGAKVS